MLGIETAATLRGIYPELANEFRLQNLLKSVEESEQELSEWLDRVLQFRSHDFGVADYNPRRNQHVTTAVCPRSRRSREHGSSARNLTQGTK
jgi:hypothetical protein